MAVINKYQNSKIYKIINLASNDEFDCYVGSTITELRKRWDGHKYAYYDQMSGKRNRGMKLYEEIDKYGIKNFKVILIENYPCDSKEQLHAYEEHWRQTLKPNYNVNKAYRSEEYIKEYNKQSNEIYREYREQNKDSILQKRKDKRNENIQSEVFKCKLCDRVFAIFDNLRMHLITQKHIQNELNQVELECVRLSEIIL